MLYENLHMLQKDFRFLMEQEGAGSRSCKYTNEHPGNGASLMRILKWRFQLWGSRRRASKRIRFRKEVISKSLRICKGGERDGGSFPPQLWKRLIQTSISPCGWENYFMSNANIQVAVLARNHRCEYSDVAFGLDSRRCPIRWIISYANSGQLYFCIRDEGRGSSPV